MPSLQSRIAPLLFALSAAAPAAARADDAQPAGPPAGPGESSRPWVDEGDAPRPPREGAGRAQPAEGASPSTPSEGGPSRPPAEESGPAPTSPGGRAGAAEPGRPRPPAAKPRAARAPEGEAEAVGFSPEEGERMHRAAGDRPARRASFGHKGQVVLGDLIGFRTGSVIAGPVGALGSGFGFGFGSVTGLFVASSGSIDQDGFKGRSSAVLLRPSADVFVADGLSVGGSLLLSHARYRYDAPNADGGGWVASSSRYDAFGLEPRLGTVVRLTDALSLWPRVGVGYQAQWAGGIEGGGPRIDVFSAFAHTGLVAELGRHAFLDVGPELRVSRARLDPNYGQHFKSSHVAASVNASIGLTF
ncbi:MAG TPA: hypothetical protein VFS43_36095 [Polyangiaceae bacterium]|nr:hypothetical protein [Polyangiaceae bacterium]